MEVNEIVWTTTAENLLQEGKIVDTFKMNEKQYYIVQFPPRFSFLKFLWDTISIKEFRIKKGSQLRLP